MYISLDKDNYYIEFSMLLNISIFFKFITKKNIDFPLKGRGYNSLREK